MTVGKGSAVQKSLEMDASRWGMGRGRGAEGAGGRVQGAAK